MEIYNIWAYRRSIRIFISIFSVTLLNNSFVFAIEKKIDEIQLFKLDSPGEPVTTYETELTKLKEKFNKKTLAEIDLVFSNNEKIRINGYLGQGTHSIIFSTSDGKAIRLPLNSSEKSKQEHEEYYKAWIKLSKGKNSKNFLFDIYKHRSNEYSIVKKLNIILTYGDFKKQYENCMLLISEDDINDPDLYHAKCNYCDIFSKNEKLIELSKEVSEFSMIGDIIPNNIAYIKEEDNYRWILLDFSEPVIEYNKDKTSDFLVFSKLKFPLKGPLAIENTVKHAVNIERQKCDDKKPVDHLLKGDIMPILDQLCKKWIEFGPVDPKTH